MWLARLTENGLLRPSFVPPAPVRALRHYARARTRLTQDRTHSWARLEKLLESALIKVSAVASKLTTLSAQDMIRAMIDGERDPQVLAGLARGRMRAKHHALADVLTGMFTDHHGRPRTVELADDGRHYCSPPTIRASLSGSVPDRSSSLPKD